MPSNPFLFKRKQKSYKYQQKDPEINTRIMVKRTNT